jgi:hypothetical protein
MEITEIILAQGHRNIQSTHKSTLEITKDDKLSKRGDCIIAVSANRALADLSPRFKENLRRGSSKVTMFIETEGITEKVNAYGNPRLILSHPTDMVVRRSDHICSRTLAIKADKAACDLSRELINRLKNREQKIRITLTVKI